MKKLLYLGFCAVLVAGVGCAISDYQIITDNDQAHDGGQVTDGTVNTNGKAHIRSFQIALIFGSFTEEAINFVDQKNNGDRTLTTSQIRFAELVIEQLTSRGVMEASALYEAPFTSLHAGGQDQLFAGKEKVIEGIFSKLRTMSSGLAPPPG